MRQLNVAVLISLLALLVSPRTVSAVGSSGIENASFSAKTVAQSNAVTARPQDPSTIMSNPAGLVEMEGLQISTGLQNIDLRTFHRNNVTGDRTKSAAVLQLVPSFYLSANLKDYLDHPVAIGVGVNSPFGFESKYPSIGVAQYAGYRNSVRMMATTMGAAAQATDWLDLGATATNYYMFDYGQSFNYPNGFVLGAAGTPDGIAITNMDGFGWGWSLGALAKPAPKHRLGFMYRSKAEIDVDGKVRVEGLINGLAQGFATAPDFETGIHSEVMLPSNYTFAYAFVPSEQWAVEFDLGLTGWQVFADQDVAFDVPNAVLRSLGTIRRNYDEVWSFHLGGHRQITDKLDWLGGFVFHTAASPKKHVDPYLPDGNRYQWSTGLAYELSERLSVDFAYFFQLIGSRHISNPEQLAKTGSSVDGRYTSTLHGGFVTMTYRFDMPFASKAGIDQLQENPSA